MKTIEEEIKDKANEYANSGGIYDSHGEQLLKMGFINGYNDALKWYDINDKDNPPPNTEDFLIKLEDGSIRRYDEDWEKEFLIVTHWLRLIN